MLQIERPLARTGISKSRQRLTGELGRNNEKPSHGKYRWLRNFPFLDSSLDIAKLRGEKDYYRLRTGKVRTIFKADKTNDVILVRKVACREEAYE